MQRLILKISGEALSENGIGISVEKVNNIALLNPKLINNSGIYNLLMSKYKKAEDAGVEIKLDFFFDFGTLEVEVLFAVVFFGFGLRADANEG